jgi:sugar (pentulose or hexulose) kinase
VLSDLPAGPAEDVVRGRVRLSGGGALLPGLAERLEDLAGIGVVVAEDPLRCVVRGAAMLAAGGAPSVPASQRPGALRAQVEKLRVRCQLAEWVPGPEDPAIRAC